jgi:hypothetical protein
MRDVVGSSQCRLRPVFSTLGIVTSIAVFCALFLSACVAGERAATGTVVRDSAGITIVENASPVWTESTRWRVAPKPAVEIGVLEGEEVYQFNHVSGATVLSDGRILIVDAGSAELRYYDASGRHLMSAGRRGEGPGELQLPHGPYRFAGDSVLVRPDRINPSLAVFDQNGRFIRSIQTMGIRLLGEVLGVLPNGDILRSSAMDPYAFASESGYLRVEMAIERYGREGVLLDTLAVVPGNEYHRISESAGGRVAVRFLPPPFAGFQKVVLAVEEVYAGTGDTFEIEVYRTDAPWPADSGMESGGEGLAATGTQLGSSLVRLVRLSRPNRPVTSSDIAQFRRHRLDQAQTANVRRRVERDLAALDFPKEMPAYRDLKVDAGGNLWVEVYRALWEEEAPPRWEIFDPEGIWLGTVETPVGLQIFEIGEDYLLGLRKGELDVQSVRRYEYGPGPRLTN